jgi:ABC-type branched-subunit amino acid transport system substrate-binding protein
MTSEGYQASAQGAAEGTFVSVWRAPQSDRYRKFLADFSAINHRLPTLEIATIPTYDATELILQYIKTDVIDSEQTFQPLKLRESLYDIKSYNGVSGTITIDPDGATRSFSVATYQFHDGALS